MPHLFDFHGDVYSPDGKTDGAPADVAAINAETNTAELAYWQTKPERFLPAYYEFPNRATKWAAHLRDCFYPLLQKAVVKTWNGTVLGHITSARVYRHNFGGRFVSMTIKGTNDATYYGRASWDHGDLVRLRKGKRQS
jgi:hypothetical protein